MSMLNGNTPPDPIAAMWGNMIASAVRGEVVGIEDKDGEVVAVVMSAVEYKRLMALLQEQEADE